MASLYLDGKSKEGRRSARLRASAGNKLRCTREQISPSAAVSGATPFFVKSRATAAAMLIINALAQAAVPLRTVHPRVIALLVFGAALLTGVAAWQGSGAFWNSRNSNESTRGAGHERASRWMQRGVHALGANPVSETLFLAAGLAAHGGRAAGVLPRRQLGLGSGYRNPTRAGTPEGSAAEPELLGKALDARGGAGTDLRQSDQAGGQARGASGASVRRRVDVTTVVALSRRQAPVPRLEADIGAVVRCPARKQQYCASGEVNEEHGACCAWLSTGCRYICTGGRLRGPNAPPHSGVVRLVGHGKTLRFAFK